LDGADDEELIDRQDEAMDELDKLVLALELLIVAMLVRLKVGVTGSDAELLPLLIGKDFFSSTELLRDGL
jgi:hypothetical protein